MKKYIIPFMFCSLLFLSCQKEFVITDGITPTTGGGGINGGTTTGCNTYFPTTLGTTWTYNNGGVTDVATIVSPDTLINGKVFKRVISTYTGSSFLREENGNVYEYMDLGLTGKIMINSLRASANIGDKWGDTLILNGIKEIIGHEMLEKNIKLQIDGVQFSDVIHTRYKTKFDYPPIYNNEVIASTDVWFGKCVGVLQTKTVSIMGGIASDTLVSKIKSYTIK